MTARRRLALYVLIVVTAGICLSLLTDWLPVLRGPVWLNGAWNWPYHLRPPGRWWMPLLAATVMFGLSVWWLGRSDQRPNYTVVGLLALTAATLFLQGSLIYAERPAVAAELVDRNLAPQTAGYYLTATGIDDPGALLADYASAMARFDSEHARTHPPGLVLGNWLLIRALEQVPSASSRLADMVRPLRCTDLWVLESSEPVLAGLAVSTLAAPIAAALAIPLAYACGRQIAGETESRLASILTATLPALLIFAPLSDQILAFLSLLALLLLFLAWRRRATALYFVSGLVISLASYASLGTLALVIAPAAILATQYWQAPDDRGKVVRWTAAFLLGLASVWIAGWLVWGTAPWAIAQTAMTQHYELVTSRREYGLWLGFNVLDLVLFSGTAVAFGFAGATLEGLRQLKAGRLSAVGILGIGTALLIVALLVSGTTRGEVGRIWLFMMPLLALAAGLFLSGWLPGRGWVLVIIALQLGLVVSIGLAWRPVEAVIVRAEKPEMAQLPDGAVEVDVAFEDGITLSRYAIGSQDFAPGDEIPLALVWGADGPAKRPYTAFVHLLDGNRELIAQSDSWPVDGQWPATCWQKGDVVVDPVRLSLPPDATPGEYELLVGLYDASDGRRLMLLEGGDAYVLAPIQVKGNG